jgi:hypothetical protein
MNRRNRCLRSPTFGDVLNIVNREIFQRTRKTNICWLELDAYRLSGALLGPSSARLFSFGVRAQLAGVWIFPARSFALLNRAIMYLKLSRRRCSKLTPDYVPNKPWTPLLTSNTIMSASQKLRLIPRRSPRESGTRYLPWARRSRG